MAVYVWGLVGIVVFYLAMLGVGIWAGTKQKNHSEEEVMLAGRSLGTVVGFLTLIGASVCFSLICLLISVFSLYDIIIIVVTKTTAAPTTATGFAAATTNTVIIIIA
jgi:Na+/proline symporter